MTGYSQFINSFLSGLIASGTTSCSAVQLDFVHLVRTKTIVFADQVGILPVKTAPASGMRPFCRECIG
jgi:hypothetical protein